MRLDFKSLAFGYKLEAGVSTPAWETSLGQGAGYKIKNTSSIDELVKGMIYKMVAPKTISFKKGRGGTLVKGDADNASLVSAAVFDRVFINDTQIQNGKFILLIVKDDSEHHRGRLKLKYGLDNSYEENSGNVIRNRDFVNIASQQLELANDACWFIYDLSVENQDTLHLSAIIINKDGLTTYADSDALHKAWDPLVEADIAANKNTTKKQGINKIFYGIPGCGKSYHIEHDILGKNPKTKKYEGDYAEENIIRTTFYQDYSNTDFVGQILPKIVKGEDGEKDIVEYIFNPGPFTLALIQAIKNPTEKVALVVEEINRGNAPAIFGDIFQLLDRGDDGVSEYGIKNVSIIDYLNNYNFGDCEAPIHYTFENIKIPGNMDIFATMNTSDQNVYTLDTAFTRRWNKERIPNEFNGNEIADFLVPGMDKYTWKEFVDSINKQIQSKLDDLQVNEDKQVGAFFVKKSDLLPEDNTLTPDEKKEKAKSFAHKVLEYLWDDVSKLDHKVIFNPTYKTFEKVVDDYLKNGVAIFSSEIFKNKSIPETTVDTE